MDAKEFGSIVGLHRTKLGMSQKELADILGKSRSYVAQIERGKKPSEEVLNNLLAILKIPLSAVIPMDELRNASPELAQLVELAEQGFASIADDTTPEQRMKMVAHDAADDMTINEILTAVKQFDIGIEPPNGWNKLNKTDRKLVQEIINRLLATERYGEGE